MKYLWLALAFLVAAVCVFVGRALGFSRPVTATLTGAFNHSGDVSLHQELDAKDYIRELGNYHRTRSRCCVVALSWVCTLRRLMIGNRTLTTGGTAARLICRCHPAGLILV